MTKNVEVTETKVTPAIHKKVSPKYRREQDSRKVKGRFHYTELPGGVLEFNYLLHKGEKPIRYTLVDGNIYTLPLSVARHLNKNVSYPEYEYIPGEEMIGASHTEEGKNMRVKRIVRRCSFEPLDFIADEELQGIESDIVQVQNA